MRKFFFVCIVFIFCFIHANFSYAQGTNNKDINPLNFSIHVTPGEEKLQINMALKNNGSKSVKLEFPTSQIYEWVIKDKIGKEIFRYSSGKAFLQAIQHLTIRPNETVHWKDEWDYKRNGVQLEKGDYIIEAWLTVTKINNKPVENRTLFGKDEWSLRGESTVFTTIDVQGKEGVYVISGKANIGGNGFYYTVDDGHNYLIDEKRISVDPSYGMPAPFIIHVQIPKEKLPKKGTLILTLYERNDLDGSINNEYAIPLEQF